jgi:hypothetical protein
MSMGENDNIVNSSALLCKSQPHFQKYFSLLRGLALLHQRPEPYPR